MTAEAETGGVAASRGTLSAPRGWKRQEEILRSPQRARGPAARWVLDCLLPPHCG